MQVKVRFAQHFAIRLGEWFSGIILSSMAVLMFCATRMFETSPGYFAGLSAFGSQPGVGQRLCCLRRGAFGSALHQRTQADNPLYSNDTCVSFLFRMVATYDKLVRVGSAPA